MQITNTIDILVEIEKKITTEHFSGNEPVCAETECADGRNHQLIVDQLIR